MENVNSYIRNKLIKNCSDSVAKLAIKAIELSEDHNSPLDVAEQMKPLIRKYAKSTSKGSKA